MRPAPCCGECGRPLPRLEGAPLTTRQAEILSVIRTELAAKGCAPTQGEIGRRVGIRSSGTVFEHLRTLEAKGYITRRYRKAQGIELVDRDAPTPAPVSP